MAETVAEKKRHLAEDFGMLFEGSGVPRMAGRIFGWLMVCDPPHQTAAEIAASVGASKGSVSTMTRLLETFGIVERFTMPGKRLTYYRVKENPWLEMMAAKMRVITAFRGVADRGLELLAKDAPEVRKRLEIMRDTYRFFEGEFPKMVERLKRKRQRKAAAAGGRSR
jgi:hypothetical protein